METHPIKITCVDIFKIAIICMVKRWLSSCMKVSQKIYSSNYHYFKLSHCFKLFSQCFNILFSQCFKLLNQYFKLFKLICHLFTLIVQWMPIIMEVTKHFILPLNLAIAEHILGLKDHLFPSHNNRTSLYTTHSQDNNNKLWQKAFICNMGHI